MEYNLRISLIILLFLVLIPSSLSTNLESIEAITPASTYLNISNNLFVSSSNVGIGTSSPGQKLDVSGGNIRTTGQLISTVATGTAPLSVSSTTKVANLNADLLDGHDTSYFQTALTNPVTGTGTANYITKWTGTTSVGNSVIYESGGNVGIGTTSPDASLNVNTGKYYRVGHFRTDRNGVSDNRTNTPPYLFENARGDQAWGVVAEFRTNELSDGSDRPSIMFSSGVTNTQWTLGMGKVSSDIFTINQDHGFYDGGWGTTRLAIDTAGNVGIGTTSPGQKLDVSGGNIRTTGQLISTVATGTAPLSVSSTTLVSNLNADLLDGLQGSSYARADGSNIYRISPYATGSSSVYIERNSPYYGAYTYRTYADPNAPTTYGAVIGFGAGASGSGEIYQAWTVPYSLYHRALRDCCENWTSWYKIWDQNNDGSGSGLDADLLDGHDSSYFQTALTNPITGTGSANYITKWTGTTSVGNSVIYESGGNIGIGTTSPGARKLKVAGDVEATGDWYWLPSKNFQLYPSANNQEWSFDLRNQGTYTGNYWQVWSDTKSTILAVRGDTGNVGIGTTSPAQKLHVAGNTYVTGYLGVGSSNPVKTLDVRGDAYISGNVGIGTTGPNSLLHLNFSTGANGINIQGQYPTIAFMNQSGIIMHGIQYFNNVLNFYRPGHDYDLVIDSSGNVGIGVSPPADKLDINGDVRVRGGDIKDSGGTARITFSGTNVIIRVG